MGVRLRRGSKRLIRDLNVATVLNLIRRYEPISRVDLAERTSLGRSTITGIINLLSREGLVVPVGSAESSGGRKPELLQLNAKARHVLAIKLAPGLITLALTDLHARVLERRDQPMAAGADPPAALNLVVQGVKALLAVRGVLPDQVTGVGAVLPGIVDSQTGISRSTLLRGWENLPVRRMLEERLGRPVFVDNDANAFALAEHWYGAGQGFDHLLAVTVGIGVGAGLVMGGSLYRGARWGAGELGHCTIDETGPLCTCGNRGCLEALAGDSAVQRLARQVMESGVNTTMLELVGGDPAAITREVVVRAAQLGDRPARRVLESIGQHLGIGLANAVNLLNPEAIVVGGEAAMQAGDLLLDPLRHTLRARSFSVLGDGVHVVPARLGADAWLMGAAAVVLDEVFKPPIYAATGDQAQVNLARTLE